MKLPATGVLLALFASLAFPHDVITTKVTFNREIVRLFEAHCDTCHRPHGMAFSLGTYAEARPWAKAIGEEVLERRMPPWGAVKGFGDFRNDTSLTPEQIELIVDWEEGGAPEGDPKDLPVATKPAIATPAHFGRPFTVRGEAMLKQPLELGGLRLVSQSGALAPGEEMQITAELPDGSVEPLLWLQNYKTQFAHPFVLRTPLHLPAGTAIHGVTQGAIALLPAIPAAGPGRRNTPYSQPPGAGTAPRRDTPAPAGNKH